jgi:hypothetical protein
MPLDMLLALQIRQRPRNPQNAMIATGGKGKPLGSLRQ